MTSVGYATGFGHIDLDSIQTTIPNKNYDISVNQPLGYQFNPYFQMGLGAGFDFWKQTAFIPIYLNLTVNFTKTKFVPLFYTNLGYSFKWYISSVPDEMNHVIHGTQMGPMGEAGLGMRFSLNERFSILIAACYKVQYSGIDYTTHAPNEHEDFSALYTNTHKDKVFYHFAGVRLGLQY
ncbi:MAG: hypothetical protein J6S87_11045 [Bacteroidales bacterium]|nr:hypothetical protein [Bacteroidales bacterium]